MARPPRITPAGNVFHVTNRATEGRILFGDRSDYQAFYRLLVVACRRLGMRVIAFCLMPTHWHLVLWPSSDGAVSEYLHWVTTQHSLHFRLRTGTVGRGHVYQDRFHSFPVQVTRYYYNLIRYVEANALNGQLVVKAEQWPWSSLFERLNGGDLITSGPLALPPHWSECVNAVLPLREVKAIRCSERCGRPYGSSKWVAQTAALQSLDQTLRGRGRPRVDFGCWRPATMRLT
jgi:putative transposase